MGSSAHELVLDLKPAVAADGHLYSATVVARPVPDGHWDAWLEFAEQGSPAILRTDIETHQANEGALYHWATMLSDVYLRGALDRAHASPSETRAHRQALAQTATARERGLMPPIDLYELFVLGEHVLRRELQLFGRATLLSLIITHDLNPRSVDLSALSRAQLVAFIVTAVEIRQARTARARPAAPRRHEHAN